MPYPAENKGVIPARAWTPNAPYELIASRLGTRKPADHAPHLDPFAAHQTADGVWQALTITAARCRGRIRWRRQLIRSRTDAEKALHLGDDVTDECAFRAFVSGATVRGGADDVTTAQFFLYETRDPVSFLTCLHKNRHTTHPKTTPIPAASAPPDHFHPL